MNDAPDRPRLIADIGGSYARFALEQVPGRFEHFASLPCAEHADFHAAVSAYLGRVAGPPPAHAAVAIANPVEGDAVRMTNYHWQFSIEQMRERLGLQTLVVVNDFTALALALPRLGPQDRRQVGGGTARERSVIGVLGAGSGLGVSGLIPAGAPAGGWVALGTEGGHASFAPRDERELAILRFAMQEFDHVSFERLASGPGLTLIHRALSARDGRPAEPLVAPEIGRRGLAGEPRCAEALDVFCAVLGTVASNLAVTLGALGGVFVGGGIVPRLGPAFDRSPFRARFEDKGRFSAYLAGIPTFVVTAPNATLLGAAAILAAQLRGRAAADGAGVLGRIRRALPGLPPAERRVATQVLAHPRAVLGDPIARIAQASSVSQPTVIRFCRSLGCQGLADFKLRLATSLTSAVPVTHSQVSGEDSALELAAKLLGNSAAAVLELRERLNRESLDRAVALLTRAGRVEFYALGADGPVAEDAQFKFLRFGVACAAITDPSLQAMAAAVLRPGDVAVLISRSGQAEELVALAQTARARDAAVLAITAGHSALARRADLALGVDPVEDDATQPPLLSRILQLLVIEILALGVALRRGASAVQASLSGEPAREEGGEPAPGPVDAAASAPGMSSRAMRVHLGPRSR